MSRRLLAHVRNNVVGYVALFIALGGSAYAVNGSLPGKNTVGSADIIDGEVKTSDIAESTMKPDAFGRFHDAGVPVSSASGINGNPRAGDEDVLSLDLPAGNYFIVAKGNLVGAFEPVLCLLYADGDRDRMTLPATQSPIPFTMAVLGGSADAFTVHLACTYDNSFPQCLCGHEMSDLKINAVAVKSLNNTAG